MNSQLYQGLLAAGARSPTHVLRALVRDDELRDLVRDLFEQGHYSVVVEQAFKFLNVLVKQRTGLDEDGVSLMRAAFSPKAPKLRVAPLECESGRSEQQGYMELFAGSMSAFRNPRAHEHRNRDNEGDALVLLLWADHLVAKARLAALVQSTTGSHPTE